MPDGRRNNGKKKGTLSKKTIEQKIAFEELRQTVLRSQRSLIASQLGLAKGLLVVMKLTKGSKKPIQVSDKEEIIDFMEKQQNGMYVDNDNGNEYFFLAAKEPDNKALDSLLDRVHGKARQNFGLDGGENDKPVAISLVEKELKEWANNGK